MANGSGEQAPLAPYGVAKELEQLQDRVRKSGEGLRPETAAGYAAIIAVLSAAIAIAESLV